MGQPALEELMTDATRATKAVAERRETARDAAIQAIRAIEAKLVEALGGDTLRGLSTLVRGESGPPYYAARVHQDRRFGIDRYLPDDGAEALVVDKRGALMMARALTTSRMTGERWEARPAEDDDLTPADLELVAAAVSTALQRHVTRAERTAASYARVEALAQKLVAAVL